jgi:ATP-dependent protease ClpP protease subunit
MTPRQWFRFENAANDETVVDIHILDLIGGWDDDWIARNFGYDMGVTARAFVEQLAALPENVNTIRVHINSPGGDVFAGVTIANALREQAAKGRTVETIIDGIAASIASVIAMAGSTITIADNALVMIHNPWSIAVGEAKDFRKTADELDVIRNTIVATYKWHSSLSDEDIVALMDATTYMDADEAIAKGFATAKVEGLKAAASIDPRAMAKLTIPDKFRDRVAQLVKPAPTPAPAPEPAAAADVLRLCREGECLDLAEALIGDKATIDIVQARVTETKTQRAAAAARATEITAICTTAKLPELAPGYISGGMSPADVRAHLVTITAKLDTAEIDGGLKPDHGQASATESWKNAFARTRSPFGSRA